MRKQIKIGNKTIREENPVFIIAEIGLNHNGDINLAKKLINVAVKAGCDAVKFQKRDPELCVPLDQRDKKRDTPWGYITYMDYRYKVEFSEEQYEIINEYCKRKGILWSASCWDVNSFKFISSFDVPFHKVASAMLTNKPLLDLLAKDGKPIISSTGMSTLDEIDTAIKILESGGNDVALLHCTSTYPCPLNEINLRMIPTLRERYSVPVGYSGHETGLVPTWAAVALGSTIVERHITLDRSMWGSDQAASVEPGGLMRMVKGIREIEASIGNGQKRVYESEKPIRDKLRF
jgi:N-acetylneuraminate synthase|tara:strand:+ start:5297 stop:6169 length:873 start_codon:yes stop_codon:yes gene_type:complete